MKHNKKYFPVEKLNIINIIFAIYASVLNKTSDLS